MKQEISPHTLVLTANQRLASYLRKTYDRAQTGQKKTAWISPRILPWSSWIRQVWEMTDDRRMLLSDVQERLLWEQIIIADLKNPLIASHQTAAFAQEAWHLLNQWEISPSLLKDYPSEDVQAFCRWGNTFVDCCHQRRWLDRYRSMNVVIKAIEEHKIDLPSTILLAGFDQLTPQSQRLVDSLSRHIRVDFHQLEHNAQDIYYVSFNDSEQEILSMARWAKQQLTNNNRVACVIPNLIDIRDELERTFNTIFSSSNIVQDKREQLAFNISAGKPLIDFQLIQIVFRILEIERQNDLYSISTILLSPFIKDAESELMQRALLDSQLRSIGERKLPLYLVISKSKETTNRFYSLLKALNNHIKKRPPKLTPSKWADYFVKTLQIMGWPGERTLNSEEHQVFKRWQGLMREFAQLDWVINKISFVQALEYLINLANETIFQPQSSDVPVQVLGSLEVTGQEFDALWVMGLTNENWPPSPSPNPFLPLTLQRQQNMPHASPARELTFCQQLMSRFCSSATKIIFSYPEYCEDKPLLPSQLITQFTRIQSNVIELASIHSVSDMIFQSQMLENLIDHQAPKLEKDEIVRGGTGIIKQQAACPFRAFAQFRLASQGLDKPRSGFDQQERGLLLHRILELFWLKMETHAQLMQHTDSELATLISTIIDEALLDFIKKQPLKIRGRFLEIEKIRLQRLLLNWLQVEKKRKPFRVLAEETWQTSTLCDLKIHMQIDRIDELADGSKIIIDYKMGIPNIQQWFGERPDEPQLPMYCVTHKEPIQGMLFAQVNNTEMTFKGITTKEFGIQNIKPIDQLKINGMNVSWQTLIDDWRKEIEKLGHEFVDGYAAVDPKDPIITCRTCKFHGFCRIHEH